MQQMSLFDETFEDHLADLFVELENTYELTHPSFRNEENKNNKGKVISNNVYIEEAAYPPKSGNSRKTVFFSYKESGSTIELIIRKSYKTVFNAEIKDVADNINIHYSISIYNTKVFDFLKNIFEEMYNSYESNARFGCCAKYQECSKAKRCLHTNKLYGKGCAYLKHLERGEIFYG